MIKILVVILGLTALLQAQQDTVKIDDDSDMDLEPTVREAEQLVQDIQKRLLEDVGNQKEESVEEADTPEERKEEVIINMKIGDEMIIDASNQQSEDETVQQATQNIGDDVLEIQRDSDELLFSDTNIEKDEQIVDASEQSSNDNDVPVSKEEEIVIVNVEDNTLESCTSENKSCQQEQQVETKETEGQEDQQTQEQEQQDSEHLCTLESKSCQEQTEVQDQEIAEQQSQELDEIIINSQSHELFELESLEQELLTSQDQEETSDLQESQETYETQESKEEEATNQSNYEQQIEIEPQIVYHQESHSDHHSHEHCDHHHHSHHPEKQQQQGWDIQLDFIPDYDLLLSQIKECQNKLPQQLKAILPKDKQGQVIYSVIIASFPSVPIFLLLLLTVGIRNRGTAIQYMIAFSFGTMLGDVFFHMLPQILGNHHHGNEHEHEHGHEHEHEHIESPQLCLVLGGVLLFAFVDLFIIKLNNWKATRDAHVEHHEHSTSVTVFLFGDFLHNFTDGIALGATFSIGIMQGITTTIAIFLHEIPHEIGDFAYMLKQGKCVFVILFTQIFTSLGCLAGGFVGLHFAELYQTEMLCLTCGSFLYVALVNILPELKQSFSYRPKFKRLVANLIAIAAGLHLMKFVGQLE